MNIRCYETSWVLLGGLTLSAVIACGGADDNGNMHRNAGGNGGHGGASAGQTDAIGGAGGASTETIENPCGAIDETVGRRDAGDLFAASQIPAFDLYLPEKSWQWLNDHAVDEEYVQAQACYNGKAIGLVGVRYKGSYGSLFSCFNAAKENTCRKLGMKIKFDEYTEKQRFFGLKRLNFHGYHYDSSYLKERLALDVYRELGIVAPRAAWALVRVNGEAQGLFGMVEQIDGPFTKDRWPNNGDGNLFKEAWPGRSDEAWTTSHLETNQDAANTAAFQAFSDAMKDDAPSEALRATLGQYVDLRYLARFMAADDAVASFDGVTTFYANGTADEAGNHNFLFYQESDHRFSIIPWDLESTMSLSSNYGNVPPWYIKPEDCSLTYPVWGTGDSMVMAPGCDNVFRALASDMTDYRAAGQVLLDGAFSLETMRGKIDRLAEFVRAEATADPHGPGGAVFETDVQFLKQELPKLRARLAHFMTGRPINPVVLTTAQVNGFETADDYGLTAGMLMSNANSTASVEVNSTEPTVGEQSIRFNFDFGNETTSWQQWAFYSLPFTTNPADISRFTGIRMTLRSDVKRTVRIDLKSPKNSKTNAGVQVGWELPVTTVPQVLEVTLASAKVPSWATDPKDDLQAILKTVTGLSFQPTCVGRDANGQLPDGVKDKGYIDIDAIEVF